MFEDDYTSEDYDAPEDYYASDEDYYAALKDRHTALQDDYLALMSKYLALKSDYLALKNGADTPVADGGNGDGATDSKTSLEKKDAPADLPKGMETPVELGKKALASDTRTAHFSPSVDLEQGNTTYWVEDETAPRVNPASGPVCKVVMEDERCGPNSRITDGGKYAAGGELVIVGQGLDAQTPGNGDTPVADGGNGDGANSLEHAPADLPKGMEMPVELSKKALASATNTEHSSPSVDLAQGITNYWVEDETAPRVNPASSPVCKVVMEDERCGPNPRITDGGKYAAGGELVIVGQALDAEASGF
ncbi:hypothetical protein [Verminephrobacter aporrectodeae]|uniref:hypothetical protein n=1 Tax=Verminephrobacter aporrectodeae TaxID=1110389 RepID=UPI0022386B9E|nr:hypothetical protein [Verminephrobacter aporrectodeae]